MGKTTKEDNLPQRVGSKGLTLLDARDKARVLLHAFESGKNPKTLLAYSTDLKDFARFWGDITPQEAAAQLLTLQHGDANLTALAYKAHLSDRGLSPATINRRLAALQSLVKLGRTLGFVTWSLEVSRVPTAPLKDTRGCGRKGFLAMLKVLEEKIIANQTYHVNLSEAGLDSIEVDKRLAKAMRDKALLRLLHDLGLRRNEVVTLDLENVDLQGGCIWILGKGQSERNRLTLPDPTRQALEDWIKAREPYTQGLHFPCLDPVALFVNFDRARKGERLTGRSLYRIVRRIGQQAGVKITPHGLRHTAITEALDITNGNVRAVQRFSRHKDIRLLNVYDDNRKDLGGQIAALIAEEDVKEN